MTTTDPFPDVRWGSESSWLRGPGIALSSTRPGSWLIRKATPLDRKLLMRTRGRFTLLGPIGAPTLLLTTAGAKSGLPRVSPLLYWRDGGRLHVVGSNFGQQQHPAWSGNLLKNPRATVTIGGKDVLVVAHLLEGKERDRVWQGFIDMARTYAAYGGRTDRHIRVFALEAATSLINGEVPQSDALECE